MKCGEFCSNKYTNKAAIKCHENASSIDECSLIHIVNCQKDRDLLVKCFDYPKKLGFPDFYKITTEIGKDRFYPGFYYDNKPNYVCDGGFRNIEANIYCRSIG